MARITDTRAGSDGKIRDVELLTSTRRKIRRPVNLLVPLEIPGAHDISQETTQDSEGSNPPQGTRRYNLRPRPTTSDVDPTISTIRSSFSTKITRRWFLFYIMIVSALVTHASKSTVDMQMTCTEKGVLIMSAIMNRSFQICTDHSCEIHMATSHPYLVQLPPHSTLHDHKVLLKWDAGGQIATMTTICRALDFCDNLNCWFCAHVLFNPECWPIGAVLLTMFFLYVIVALSYLLLYVPMTIGKPIRLILHGIKVVLVFLFLSISKLCLILFRRVTRRHTPTRRDRLTAALAVIIFFTILSSSNALACQQVNTFEHHTTYCTMSNGKETCQTKLTELLKISTFHQEACLRVTHNSSLIVNLKVRWKGLYLQCEQETLYFTRATNLHVLASKRCPHMGSCSGGKCADINSSTLLPELKLANTFTGRTGCLECCGGLGCDCFYPSSGCLFYRVYAIPLNPTIYEIFRCIRWKEKIKVEVIMENPNFPTGKQRYVEEALPNVPLNIPSFQLTMTSLSLPPTPTLQSTFITHGHASALWRATNEPSLLCPSREMAALSNCTFKDDCCCSAAENTVNCQCSDLDIEREFNELGKRLPITSASWELSQRYNNSIVAKIPQMVSAEFVLDFAHSYDTASILLRHDLCTISNSSLHGCYRCSHGAQARVQCQANTEILGEVVCGTHAFVVPCGPQAPESLLRFHFDAARQFLHCSIQCGDIAHYFALSGILKYVGTFRSPFVSLIEGNSVTYKEIAWPDFEHIVAVLCSWYKTFFLGLIIVALALLFSYACLPTIGLHLLKFLMHSLWVVASTPLRIIFWTTKTFCKRNVNYPTHAKVL